MSLYELHGNAGGKLASLLVYPGRSGGHLKTGPFDGRARRPDQAGALTRPQVAEQLRIWRRQARRQMAVYRLVRAG